MPLRRGRLLDARDRAGRAARRRDQRVDGAAVLSGRDPLGQRIQLGTEPTPEFPTMEIVGVVGDVKQSFEAGSKAEMFVPYAQYPDPILAGMYRNIVARRADGRRSRRRSPRRCAPRFARSIRISRSSTCGRWSAAMAEHRRAAAAADVLLTIFAGVAVALAVVGVYGVMAYTVSQRTPEIGVRMALARRRRRSSGMVVWQGARLAMVGIVLGLVGAALARGRMQSLLFEIERPRPADVRRRAAGAARRGARGQLHPGPARRADLADRRARPVE